MRNKHHKVARAYVLYREERARERAKAEEASQAEGKSVSTVSPLRMKRTDGSLVALDARRLAAVVEEASETLAGVSAEAILAETERNLYDGISEDELALAPILAARTLVETDPDYARASARLLLDKLRAKP